MSSIHYIHLSNGPWSDLFYRCVQVHFHLVYWLDIIAEWPCFIEHFMCFTFYICYHPKIYSVLYVCELLWSSVPTYSFHIKRLRSWTKLKQSARLSDAKYITFNIKSISYFHRRGVSEEVSLGIIIILWWGLWICVYINFNAK